MTMNFLLRLLTLPAYIVLDAIHNAPDTHDRPTYPMPRS